LKHVEILGMHIPDVENAKKLRKLTKIYQRYKLSSIEYAIADVTSCTVLNQ